MTDLSKLRGGFKQFYQKYFIDTPELYRQLVRDGQSPKTLIIACSDSRVDPSTLLNTHPGDIFVIRNVANLVPPFEADFGHCHGTSAAIEYAVKHLMVENIIVLGHSHCGGIKTLVEDHENDHSFIDEWLYIARDAKVRATQQALDAESVCCCCEKEAIKTSLKNLKTFPFIRERLQNRSLQLFGWYFRLENGELEEVA